MSSAIGLAALNAASKAIDATSNNIANAQTVGYKAGQFVFQDEFFRATDPQNPNRAGMGVSATQIRRAQTNGTIISTSNPLDLAVGGLGMFTTATKVDATATGNPSNFQYTRNGQFGVDNENRILNANGNYLVGYPANLDGTINTSTSSVMSLSQAPLPGAQTKATSLSLNLDNTTNPIGSVPFNNTIYSTYSQTTSQTLYDSTGLSHTLSTYYVKLASLPLTITPGTITTTNGVARGSYTLNPLQGAGTAGAQIASTATPATTVETLSDVTVEGVGTADTFGVYSNYTMTLQNGTKLTVTPSTLSAASGTPATKTVTGFSVPTSRFAVFATIDGTSVAGSSTIATNTGTTPGVGGSIQPLGVMAFVAGLNIDSLARDAYNKPTLTTKVALTAVTGGTSNPNTLAFTIDSTDMTAYSAPAQTYVNTQDGKPLSQLSSYSFDATGKLMAQYSNGESKVQGQVKLAQFNNDVGLIPIGGNSFEASALSGDPTYGSAGSGLFGQLKAQALEQSNVDLTSQLVTLMSLQRQYSAASQVVKTTQTLEDTVLNKLG